MSLAVVAAVVRIKQMPENRWVQITQATARSESATRLDLTIDICNPRVSLPSPRVVETSSEVRISIDLRVKSSPNDIEASCASSATVTLNSPLQARRVIDGHSGHEVEVILSDSQSP
jgi:hypothetical protein